MLEIARKVKQGTGGTVVLSISTATMILNGVINGADIISLLSTIGIAATGGASKIIAEIGRAAIKRMIKKVGRRKAAIW
ncbi:uberolysin/carnocyclin family circular bacteriocin [Staphylococcus cornubiensis]|uniref:uberolysin/carnocyclin family circular bacteriocin n=1 Tax=Staphylococcus cornubiensis TaxID=1986155 RepID=UPI000A3998CE|nr:uberolysin/carnocyclin family circular bacteriocin [Staphylococcus cornubiensis]